MGTTEKAIVEGLEETTKEEAGEEPQNGLEELMKMVDFTLSKEVTDGMRGIFDGTGIYNFCKGSFTGEKICPECDLMKGGCPMKGKQPHIHVVGIGVQGALKAMRVYGRMKIKNAKPEIFDKDGKQYWVAHCEIVDGHNGNELDLWYYEPVMRKAGDKLVENESAPQIAQSKGMRNTILAIIPGDLPEKWVEDYRQGKRPFSPERVKEYEQAKEPKTKNPKRPKAEPPAASEFNSETIPDNKELDNMTVLNDLLSQIAKAESLERLQAVWTVSYPTIKKHPAFEAITKAKDEKKAELLKAAVPEQGSLTPGI